MRDLDKVLLKFAEFRKTYVHTPNVESLKFSVTRKTNAVQDEKWEVMDANSFITYTCITDSDYNFLQVDANLNDYANGHTPRQLHHWSNMDYTDSELNKIAMSEVCRQVYAGHTHLLRRSLSGGQKMLITIAVMKRAGTFEESTFVSTILMEDAWRNLLELSAHHDLDSGGCPIDRDETRILEELFSSNSNYI